MDLERFRSEMKLPTLYDGRSFDLALFYASRSMIHRMVWEKAHAMKIELEIIQKQSGFSISRIQIV